MFNYYNWTEISSVSSNWFSLESVISWEDSSFLLNSDVFFFLSLFLSSTASLFFSTSAQVSTSSIDFIITFSNTFSENYLLNSVFFDSLLTLNVLNTLNSYLFFSNQGDFLLTAVLVDRDFYFFFGEFFASFSSISTNPLLTYDAISWSQYTTVLDYIQYFVWLSGTLVFILVALQSALLSKFTNTTFSFLGKFFLFMNNFSFENRLQLDWGYLVFAFILFIQIPLLMTYDDTNVELVELLNGFICYFFLFIIGYLLFKYSIHYFAFLENSVSEGFSTSFIAKQFVRDVSNTFALFLRFFLLLFRLNIYDGLDDFLDSYYIFFIDFDEDSYFDELLFNFNFFFYCSDNREDLIFYAPAEYNFWLDLYSKYFIIFGKLFFFWLFILEEIFRVSLALYISYLIIFEVHAVNTSYSEDCFFAHKRN